MFIEKLNIKQEGVYVIEEEKTVIDGIWEGYLNHDNVNHETIYIYTGPKLTGEKVENYFISTPSETPWKTHLKVFSESEKIYITYETTGDQVEAEDINLVQDEIVNEIERATLEEIRIDTKLDSEIDRSVNMDNTLNRKINNEVERSEAVDIDLNNKITSEIERSKQQDQIITTNLINETNRAKDAENKLKQDITNEEARAINKENEIKGNLNSHIDNYNNQVLALKEKDSKLERDKADKVYVDAELNKKYNKDEVFTKDEVLQRIQDIIGAAPEALDTLEELARALDNDPNFATNIINLLGTKVDKVDGKQLSTNDFTNLLKAKLDGIEDGANKYIHPDTHNADMIVESSSKRFVSDIEKANWDNKETPSGAQKKANIAESNAKAYTDVHDNNTVKHITTTERSNWDDANSKKHTHSNKSILDTITQTLLDRWNSAVEHIKDSVRHITSVERTKWNAKAEKSDIPTKVGQLENDKNYVTQSELGNAGYGDMMKSTYDKDNDGVVDKAKVADNVPWDGVTNKPSTFPSNSHKHRKSEITDFPTSLPANGGIADKLSIVDTRNDASSPSYYFSQGRNMFWEFKFRTSVGNPPTNASASSTYAFILTITGWSNYSGGYPVQVSVGGKNLAIRQGISNDAWGNWFVIPNTGDIPTKLNQLKGPLTCNQLRGV